MVLHCVKMQHNVGTQDLLGGHTHSMCVSGIRVLSPHLRCLGKVYPNPDGLERRSCLTELSLVTAGYMVKARSLDNLASPNWCESVRESIQYNHRYLQYVMYSSCVVFYVSPKAARGAPLTAAIKATFLWWMFSIGGYSILGCTIIGCIKILD